MSEFPDNPEVAKPTIEFENQPQVLVLGALEDFGLGNKINGIPSELAEASEIEKLAYGERLKLALSEVEDINHYGCIDGRLCACNADDSAALVRRRQVSGTGSVTEIAMNSDAAVIDAVEDGSSLDELYAAVDDYYTQKTGVRRSAHTGGCGGLNGAVVDNQAINTNPAVMKTVEAVMNLQPVHEYTGIAFNIDQAAIVQSRAAQTAEVLESGGWVGQDYVDSAIDTNPAGVEKLETADDEFHGHREPAVVFILSTGDKKYSLSDKSMRELSINPPFVVSLDASYDMAKALGSDYDESSVERAFMANLAKHVAVADRLPSSKTPVYLMIV